MRGERRWSRSAASIGERDPSDVGSRSMGPRSLQKNHTEGSKGMEYRKLGNLDVSAIGLGTLRTFDVTEGR